MQCEEPIRGNLIKICSGGEENSPSILSILEMSFRKIHSDGGTSSYNKVCVKWPQSKTPKIGFQDQLDRAVDGASLQAQNTPVPPSPTPGTCNRRQNETSV